MSEYSNDDVEDELLALAGGGDSDDGASSRPSTRQRSRTPRSPSRSPQPADKSPPRSTAAKKSSSKKRRSDGDSEDEGEASEPGTPSSQGSAAMDESDSDDESTGSPAKALEDEENQYPIDGLFASLAEKKEIMSLREVEREQILADREAEKERLRQKALLRRLVTNNEDKQKQKKRKPDAEDDDDEDGGARKKTKASGGSSKFDALKRARAEKSDRRSRRDTERRRDRSPSYRSDSSRSRHSDDSDVEWAAAKKKRSKTPPEEAPLADLRDIERCRLSRTRFARVAFFPGFQEALTGCYVRVHIGPDPNTGQSIYRMAVIKGFKTGRPYAIENDRGKSMVVDEYVVAAHGKAEREWPFIACSESNFTDSEWNRYQVVCKNENVNIPRKPELARKSEDIHRLINHSWTQEEIAEKLRRQNGLMDRFSGADRTRLERELSQARAHHNEALAAELQDKLDNMPQPRLAFQTTLKKAAPAKPTTPSQQDRLAEKNAANRQANARQVREAQLAERRRVREVEEREAASRANTPAGDGNGTPKSKSKGDKGGDAALPHIAKLKQEASGGKSSIPQIHKVLTDDDVIGAMDLDIDVDID